MPRKVLDGLQENDNRKEQPTMNEQQQTPPTVEIPFFDGQNIYCKVYNDGSHYVATPYCPTGKAPPEKQSKTDTQRLFDEMYTQAAEYGLKRAETLKNIREQLQPQFPDETALDTFIAAEMKRTARNIGVRKKRFRRKAYFNEWHYFVTAIYFYGHFFGCKFICFMRRMW